jgi:PAS domain S-box-containing protein
MQKLPRWYGCAVGAGAVALAALARYALHGSLGSSVPLVAFVPAVFVAAAVGGLRAGLATTALALAVGLSAFVPVAEWDTPGVLVRGALFAAVGATISAALERLRALGALTAEQRQALADAEAYRATVEEARRRNSQGSAMRAMLQVATSVLASASHEEAEVAVDEVLGIIGRFAHADRAYVFHFDWERRLAHNTHEWCADGTAPMIDRLRNVPMEEAKELLESIVEGRLRWIPDVSALTSEKERSFLEAQGIQSILMMPLMHQGRCVGFVGFDWVHDKVRVLQDTHVESLEVFSGLMLTHLGRVFAWRALQESEQRYRLLFSSMTQGVVVHDGTGAIIDCNKSAETILGFTRDMILGRDSHDPQWRAVRADGTPCPGEEHPAMVVLRTRQPCLGVIMGLAMSATTRWIRINAAPAVSANNDTIVFATFDDITAEREADTAIRLLSSQIEQDLRDREREVRDVLDNLPTFVALIDPDGTVRWVNRAPLQAGGLTPEDVVGRKFWDCPWWTHDPAQIARVRDTILAAVAGQRARYDATIRGAGDTRVEIDFQVEVVRDAAGAVRYVIPAAVDVTDRRRAERAVRESEERFRAVFESVPVGLLAVAADGAIVMANRRISDWFGYTPGELLGRPIEVLVPPAVQGRHGHLRDGYLAAPTAARMGAELNLTGARKDGTEFPVEVGLAPMQTGGEKLVLAMVTDITARRIAEQVVRVSEARYRAVFDSAMDCIISIDRRERVVEFNPAAERTFGFTKAEVLGRELGGLIISAVHRDQHAAGMERFVRTGVSNILGKRLVGLPAMRKDGTTFPAELTVVSMDLGEDMVFTAFLRDITDQREAERAVRESEERFRAVFESLAEGVVVQDAAGAIMTCNDRACAVLGLTRDQMTGRTSVDPRWRTVYEDGTPLPGEEHPSMRVLRTGLPVFDSVMGIHTPDGELRWLLVNAVPVRCTGDGPGPATVASFHDITAARALDERVRASLREKELLLKEIHHRVKNNLQIVSTLLDLQSDFTTDRAALTMFAESRSRVKSMALVHERLYKSHDVARVDLGDYTRALAADLFRAYRASDEVVRLDVDVTAPPLPLDVAIPCGLLLNELMSNCFKHAFADGRTGTLRVALAADGGAHELTVADDGPGLPPGYDFRNAASFGLQLVSTLVEQLGGTIDVGGPGATFTVRFRTSPK